MMEEKLLLLLLYAVTYVEWISFYCVVLKEQFTQPTKKNFIVFLVLLTLRIVGIVFWGHRHFMLDVVWIAFCCAFLSMTMFQAVKKWIYSYVVLVVLESSVACVLDAFSLYSTKMQYVGGVWWSCVAIAIIWLYYFVIGRKINKEHLLLPKKVWRLLTGVLFIIMLMMTYFSFVLSEVPNLKMVKVGSVIILLGGLSICGMVMAVIYYFNGTAKYRLQNEMSEKYNEQQREYFTRLLEKEQVTRQFRHDIINHLIVMHEIASKEHSEQLDKYIDELLQDINNEQYQQYDVGNEVVNTILNYYLLPLKEECDIRVDGYMGELGGVSSKDLCTIVSNITKNAVEAVENIVNGNKSILVHVNCGKKYWNIKIENTMQNDIIISNDGLPQTSKVDKDNHGIGLQNVKRIVEKYNGKYTIETGEGRFITEIYIKI